MQRIFMSLLFLCALLNGYAQESNDTTYVYPRQFLLDDLVVSANRWEQNLREVSNHIVKIDLATVQFQNPQTAADLLGVSNQVFIQKSQLGGGSPMIRGFATNRVLLVIDGVRMNNAIFRSGNLQNVISLDPNAINESEVVFGPGSVIYGSDAIGGVMDFHTLTPQYSKNKGLKVGANALTRYSSANNEQTGHVDFNIGTSRFAFLTSVTYSDYDDLMMGSDGPEEYTRPTYQVFENGTDVELINPDPNEQIGSAYNQFNFMQKVRFKPSDYWDLTYAYHYSKTSDYGRYDRLILTKSDGTLANGDWHYGPQEWQMHSLTANFDKPTKLTDHARFLAAYQDYGESRHNRSFGSTRLTNRFENVKAYSLNVDLEKTLTNYVALFYGAEVVSNKVGSTAFRNDIITEAITPVSTRYPDGSTWSSYAAYLSMKMKLNDYWLMNISNRYSQVITDATFDKTFYDFPFDKAHLNNKSMNGSIGFIYNPIPEWKFFTNLSTGFRAPNVDDIGKVFDSEPGNVVIPNPDLEPEEAYSIEIGATGKLVKNLTLDFSMFYTTMDNAIARGPSTFNGQDSILYDGQLSRVLSLQNIAELYVYGIQAGIIWDITNEFQLTSNFNLQKGKEKDPETGRDYSPTHVAPSFGATHFTFTKRKIKADLYANYNGEISFDNLSLSERGDAHLYAKDSNGNPYAPAWTTLNIKGSYNILKNVTVDAGIENILDKRYRPYSSGISAPGRNFIIALRAKL